MVTHAILAAANQAWPPFVLVAGLLLIGAVAADDGLFEATGARLARSRLGPRALLVGLLALVAAVTAVLNLDTAVLFLTPVLVHAARRRDLDERPFLYGAVFMANAASLLLPGSNLTNLLVLRSDPQAGISFAARMLPAWLAACTITTAFVCVSFALGGANRRPSGPLPPLRLRVGAAATLVAAVLVVLLPNPAVPVLVVGLAAIGLQRLRPRLDTARAHAPLRGRAHTRDVGASLARAGEAARLERCLGGRGNRRRRARSLLNNLPATVLLTGRTPTHPFALLLGLDLGPNLAVTGSLSAVLWLQAARSVGARPSIATYTKLGVVLVPLTLAVTVAVSSWS